jgi:hypothetical protein
MMIVRKHYKGFFYSIDEMMMIMKIVGTPHWVTVGPLADLAGTDRCLTVQLFSPNMIKKIKPASISPSYLTSSGSLPLLHFTKKSSATPHE